FCASVFFLFKRKPPHTTLFPYTTLFRSDHDPMHGAGVPLRTVADGAARRQARRAVARSRPLQRIAARLRDARDRAVDNGALRPGDRKSTRLNSSHVAISYAVFCLKKKNM